MLRVLTLSTLFPDATRPNFGVFVERQTQGLASHPDVELRVVAPIGLPPGPLARFAQYRPLSTLPRREVWRGLDVTRPRFTNIPGTDGRHHPRQIVRALAPVLRTMRHYFPFDVIDAEFFYPDGPAAVELGAMFDVPVSIKARGADIHHWGTADATRDAVTRAGYAADGTLAVSEALRADMIALGLPGDHITVHRTGIDRHRFHPRDRDEAKAKWGIKGPLVVSVGALIERKCMAVVIGAVQRLPGTHLLIAGEGPQRPKLEEMIAAAGMEDCIRLLGAVPHDELPSLYAAADVMALASTSEGLANVWVEALASGTPIVVSDAGGAAEVVTRPEAGRIVERRPDAFATAIRAILADPPERSAVAATANNFSWETNTVQLYAHLSGLVRRHRAGDNQPVRSTG
jgi:teichuronic acid biosynthesis glycosyltransferase TuaC